MTTKTSRDLQWAARAARRHDLIEHLTDAVTVTDLGTHTRELTEVAFRPSREEIELQRWDIPGRDPVWCVTAAIVDWGGGDASVGVDVIVTEYDVTVPEVMDLVLRIARGISPAGFVSRWTSISTNARLRLDGDLPGYAAQLAADLAGWAAAVTQLRGIDTRPLEPPVAGSYEL